VSGSLPACFEHIAATHHGRVALVSDSTQWTYAQLNATANRVAHTLLGHGGAPEDRVAVLMEHDAPAIATLIAVLKAGRTVVTLNPAHPPARLRELIADCEPALIIADANLHDLAAEISGPRCRLVRFEEDSAQGPEHNPAIAVSPRQLARLAYTSGSTGRPKGVMQTHRQIRRNVAVASESMALSARDRMPLFGSLSVGQGVNIAWCSLLNGMALYPFPVAVKGVIGLADWMTERGITIYASTASLFRNFMRTLEPQFKFSDVRVVRVGGEPATSDDFKLFQRHFSPDCWFLHTLTSSEVSNIAWSRRLPNESVPDGYLSIGALSDGQEVLLLGEDGRPVGRGEVGEIVVRSQYVAEGYWRNPELSEHRFSAALDAAGTREVRTGDLGRINADGMLEFYGRRDDRIKVRGHRVEPGEIVAALQHLDGIERAVVEAVPRTGREPLLVGFITVGRGQSWTTSELRRALRSTLPDHMVPSDFVQLKDFPLTSGGKLDREALRQGFQVERPARRSEQSASETEALVAAIWAEVFEAAHIGRHDDFFALGGDSLMAAVVSARLYSVLRVELNLQTFTDHPTVAELAICVDELLASSGQSAAPPLAAVSRGHPLPLSTLQLRVWNGSQSPDGMMRWTGADWRVIEGPLDYGAFCDCIDYLVARHEIMRTTFPVIDGRPMQVIHPARHVPIEYIDLVAQRGAHERERAAIEQRARPAIDLRNGPLFRYNLVRTHENEHWWLRVIHHLITDAWSSDLVMRELGLLYDARQRGEAPPLPEREPLQYADFAVWQQRILDPASAAYRASVEWWKSHLAGAPQAFVLPLKRAGMVAGVDPAEGRIELSIDPAISLRLDDIGRRNGATFFAVRLGAFVAFLGESTGQSDLVLGSYVTNRTHVALQGMLGFFANLATLRFVHSSRQSFLDLLANVRAEAARVAGQSDIPYDELRGEVRRSGADLPDIQIIFGVKRRRGSGKSPRLTIRQLRPPPLQMPWGFSVNFREDDETSECHVDFDAGIYDPLRVRAFLMRFIEFADESSRQPDLPIGELAARAKVAGIGRGPGV
jgi:nonribosomal peptide synthetase DhbF